MTALPVLLEHPRIESGAGYVHEFFVTPSNASRRRFGAASQSAHYPPALQCTAIILGETGEQCWSCEVMGERL